MIGNAAIYIWQLMLDRCRNGKSQNPYLTGQVNLKFQKPMTETLTRTESQRFSVPGAQEPRPLPQMWTANFFGILSFGHWNLFGILGDFFVPLFAFFFQLFEMRDYNRQKLQDNRSADVRHNAKGKHGKLLESAPGKHIKNSENRTFCLFEK